METRGNATVLFSGGVDSTACVHLLSTEVFWLKDFSSTMANEQPIERGKLFRS